MYSVRDGSVVRIFKSTGEVVVEIRPDFTVEGLFGGPLLAVKSQEFVIFYDW